MSRTILCTTGTSVGQGCAGLRALQAAPKPWDFAGEELGEQIAQRLAGMDLSSESGRVKASAEINSLHRLGLCPTDTVALLVTDTADGRICAESVAGVLRAQFQLPEDHVRIEKIEGLQVHDAGRLREVGLPNLLGRALAYIRDPQRYYGGEIVLNPTGGFKGVVPFLTVLGMLFGLRSVYVFEFAESLISLPPLPVSFDLELFGRAGPGLELIEEETTVAEERFFAAIPEFRPHERDLFMGFLEHTGDGVTMSTLAEVLWTIDRREQSTIFLAPAVATQIESLPELDRRRVEMGLYKLKSPLWRARHIKTFHGCELLRFGLKRDPFRFACTMEGTHVFVCALDLTSDHAEYERTFAGLRRDAFDLTSFHPWNPTESPLEVRQEITSLEQEAVRDLKNQINALQAQLRDAGQPFRDEIRSLKGEVGRLRARLRDSDQNVKGLEAEVRDLKDQNRRLAEKMEKGLSS